MDIPTKSRVHFRYERIAAEPVNPVHPPVQELRCTQRHRRRVSPIDIVFGVIAFGAIGAAYAATHGIAIAMVVQWLERLLGL